MEHIPTEAAQVIVTIIPIVGILFTSIVLFLYLILWHKQRMTLIEKDQFQRIFKDVDVDSASLFSGMVLFAVGFSLLLFFWIKEGIDYGMLSGLIPFSIGVSLISFFVIRLRIKRAK